MIREVRFRNFKGLRHVDMDLERFTVLVGPNASGKTSVLEGLQCLSELFTSWPAQWFRGEHNPFFLYTRSGEGPMEIQARGEMWGVRLTGQPPHQLPPDILTPHRADELVSQWGFQFDRNENGNEAGRWEAISPNTEVTHFLLRAALMRLNPSSLASPSVANWPEPRLAPDGQGLSSFLAYTALNRPEEFGRLQEALRAVVPSVQRVRFERVQARQGAPEWAESLVFDFLGAPSVPGYLASEGTLLVLGVLSAFFRPSPPNLVLLDDLDHGLHPRAQRGLVSLFRRLLEQHPQLQIIATTHSPYLLDQLRPEEVRLTTLRADGTVACARLDAHPDFEKWKEEMTPGEFWSLVGEKWVPEQQAVESR